MALLRYLLILFFIPSFAYAQHEITGTIYSDDSGETLPSATVIIENTLKGTITNNEGQFSISVDEFPVILRISYIGFETQTVRVQHQLDSPLSIRLKPSVTELEAIVVTDRDPGLSIMEKVIERKRYGVKTWKPINPPPIHGRFWKMTLPLFLLLKVNRFHTGIMKKDTGKFRYQPNRLLI